MSYHCWRSGKTRVKDDDEITWPKLPNPSIQERPQTRGILRSRGSQLQADLVAPGCSEEVGPLESLDKTDYPKLGESSSKRRHSFVEYGQLAIADHFANPGERRLRVPRSTDLIRVNLEETLEEHRWPISLLANQRAKKTVDICKLNVNMSVASPLAKWLLTKSKRRVIYVEKSKKRKSRLKGLILYERMIRKQLNACLRQNVNFPFNPTSREDISTIDLDGLRISAHPLDEPELLKKMSALSCLTTKYRDPVEISVAEDNVVFRPDLQREMENLSIDTRKRPKLQIDDDNDPIFRSDGFINADMIKATESLKICDETGEFVENICIKKEPNGFKFSKKFREYCTNTVTPQLKSYLDEFLAEISRLQKKLYDRDTVKGQSKRRYYSGIKEVQKHINLKKIKFVVIAPDLEKVEIEGGLDDTISKLVGTCKRYEVPYCFGLGRRKIGYYTHGRGFVSCIGVANYSGAEEKLKNVLLEVVEARNEFSRLSSDQAKTIDVEKLLPKEELLLSEIINVYLKLLATAN